MNVASDFFKFVILVAILMVVIAGLRYPAGITATLNGFSSILSNLKVGSGA